MRSRSRATLFLIEQLIVIAVFALCAAACARILTAAYFDASSSRDLSYAILAAENGADSFKATGGDLGNIARLLGGVTGNVGGASATIVHYDKNWQLTGENDAVYRLLLLQSPAPATESETLSRGVLSVEKLTGDSAEVILAFQVITQANS